MSNKEAACVPRLKQQQLFQRAVVCRPLAPALLHILASGRLASFFGAGSSAAVEQTSVEQGFTGELGEEGSQVQVSPSFQIRRAETPPPRYGATSRPRNAARRARTSAPSADVHMLPHLSSEILIWKANSPSFVRGALSPLAGVQCCNEQQLARRPVLGSCIPHSDECVICCLFSARFCSAPNRPRTHTRPVCVTHLAMARSARLQEEKLRVSVTSRSCVRRSLPVTAQLLSMFVVEVRSFATSARSAILNVCSW